MSNVSNSMFNFQTLHDQNINANCKLRCTDANITRSAAIKSMYFHAIALCWSLIKN